MDADRPHDATSADYHPRRKAVVKKRMPLIHPVEVLLEEFMKGSNPPISANLLAKALQVPPNRITAIIKGQRGITGDTAVRLGAFFNTTSEF